MNLVPLIQCIEIVISMIQFNPKSFVFLMVTFFVIQQIGAQKQINIQSTAVPFMLISPDARSGGMGNLSLAMSPDANDLFGNTAKLPFMSEKQGFLIKSRLIPYATAVVRINKVAVLVPPKDLPIREIQLTEYWLST
jgi:hypothetical protein